MVDLQTILSDHKSKAKEETPEALTLDHLEKMKEELMIPALFFEQVLIDYKLSRPEIMVLMFVDRKVYSDPNLYRKYGVSPLMSHSEIAEKLGLSIDEIYYVIRNLEEFGFISTIRSGQYFVRKYFSKANDRLLNHTYDDFEF